MWVTVLPLCFISLTTLTASAQMISGNFLPMFSNGLRAGVYADTLRGGLCTAAILFLIVCFIMIVITTISRCVEFSNRNKGNVS